MVEWVGAEAPGAAFEAHVLVGTLNSWAHEVQRQEREAESSSCFKLGALSFLLNYPTPKHTL